MKIIISPTKKMVAETNSFLAETTPLFLKKTQVILDTLNSLTYEEAKALWKCNDQIAAENRERLKQMELANQLSPAVMSYKGLQFQYMSPDLFSENALTYMKENLRILSGFYGVLRPFDGITPYRLEMQTPLQVDGHKNLYHYWGSHLYDALDFSDGPVINLASKEYTKAISPYLKEGDQLIEIMFANLIDGKLKVKATLAKMARGQMVRYMAENHVEVVEDLQHFDHPHYQFSAEHSTSQKYVFIYQD